MLFFLLLLFDFFGNFIKVKSWLGQGYFLLGILVLRRFFQIILVKKFCVRKCDGVCYVYMYLSFVSYQIGFQGEEKC